MGRGRAALRAVAELETFDADEIWEQMIRQVREAEGGADVSRDTVYWQAWLDIVTTINRDRALYGVSLAPLHLDPLLAQPIAINDDMAGYHVGYTEN